MGLAGLLLSTVAVASALVPRQDAEPALDDVLDAQPAVEVATADVASVNVFNGEMYDPAQAPWPGLRPGTLTAVRITGTTEEVAALVGCGTVTTCNEEMASSAYSEVLVFRITFADPPAELPPSYGVNVYADTALDAAGRFFYGLATAADCGVSANVSGGQLYLTTTTVPDPAVGTFVETAAPLAGRLDGTEGVLVLPATHPCAAGLAFQVSTFVLAGLDSSVEHASPPTEAPWLPFPQAKVAVGVPPSTTPSTSASPTTQPRATSSAAAVTSAAATSVPSSTAISRAPLPLEPTPEQLELEEAADALAEGDLGDDDEYLVAWLGVAVASGLAIAFLIWWWLRRRRVQQMLDDSARELDDDARPPVVVPRGSGTGPLPGGGSTQLDEPLQSEPVESILDEIDAPDFDALTGGTGTAPAPPPSPRTIGDELVDPANVPKRLRPKDPPPSR